MRVLLFVFGLLQSCLLFSQEKIVEVNGQKFGVLVKGVSNKNKLVPTVVFENGLGMDLNTWNTVIDQIARSAPVVTYNRAGIGTSEKVFQMPTAKRVADNLKALLATLKIPPPYLLVGHSMGGVYARGFAGYYPNDVVGVILIDPADFTESKAEWNSIFRELGVTEKKIDEMMFERLYKKSPVDSVRFGPWSEGQVLNELRRSDFDEFEKFPPPNGPMYFLVGGKFDVPVERRSKDFDQQKFFIVKTNRNIERWREVIDASPKSGMLIYLPNCGHYVHRDDPGAVVNTVEYALRNIQGNREGTVDTK